MEPVLYDLAEAIVAYAEDEITLPRLSVPSLIEAERARVDELHDEDVDEAQRRWLVQLELEPEQIVPLYRLGLARGAVVWRDGMEEWRPLLIMRELRQLLTERTRRARQRLTSLANLDARPPVEEPVLPLVASSKKKSVPPPAPSSRSPLPFTRVETPPLEARIVLAPKGQSARPPALDNDLALLMELSQRPARPHAVRFSEVVHVRDAGPSVSPRTPLALTAQVVPAAQVPVQPANDAVTFRRSSVSQKAGASPTLVAMTAVAAMVVTTLFFLFGPVRTARSAADQAEKVVMMLAPASGDGTARSRGASAPIPPPASEAAPLQQLASTIPVMNLSDLDSSGDRSSARGGRARGSEAEEERPSSAAPKGGAARSSAGPDRRAIAGALAGAASRAAGCAQDAKGTARAVVTFGNSGAVRSVSFESQLPSG